MKNYTHSLKEKIKNFSPLYKGYIRIKKYIYLCIYSICRVFICPFLFKGKKIWVFGAWGGFAFNDSPKYLYLYVKEHQKEITPVWLTRKPEIQKKIRALGGIAEKIGSLTALLYNLSAEAWFYTHNHYDVSNFCFRHPFKVQLWHGMPLKKIRLDFTKPSIWGPNDLAIATSEDFTEVLSQAFAMSEKDVVITGLPRNDVLFDKLPKDKVISNPLVTERSRIISYLPTWREGKELPIFERKLKELMDSKKLLELLKSFDAVLFIKEHQVNPSGQLDMRENNERIIAISSEDLVDVQELLSISDILITDYSGCYIDYLLLDRPIVFYCYDFELYSSLRGFIYEYNEITPGPKVQTLERLCHEIGNYLQNPHKDSAERERMCAKFNKHRDNRSCERLLDIIEHKYFNTSRSTRQSKTWSLLEQQR